MSYALSMLWYDRQDRRDTVDVWHVAQDFDLSCPERTEAHSPSSLRAVDTVKGISPSLRPPLARSVSDPRTGENTLTPSIWYCRTASGFAPESSRCPAEEIGELALTVPDGAE